MTRSVNLHVILWPINPWPEMAETWKRAEELGFAGAWLYDHLAWRGHSPWDDAYASLAAGAAITSSIRLGTLVTSPNFRTPIPTASAVRTIDRISGGRLTLGIGAGGEKHESDGDVLGIEWTPKERADRFAEWVTHLDAMLTEKTVSLSGAYWSAREVTIAPGLVQHRPPFWIAGNGPRGMALAARHGQGWIANPQTDQPLAEVTAQVAKVGQRYADAGRDFTRVPRLLLTGFTEEPWLESPDAFDDLAGRYAEAGITDVAIHWPRPGSEWDADMSVFEEIATRTTGA
ncbi:alkanesulfonate monooxygenase SsuD/methylene tetrahydromethanopterin reductase-like flavin-dependent oxidoreductase (luciferase family) [Nocardioides thalensis]|uniref:Alkanesulfonate monooxygenase SsuD/methylene tetrahydromethanopterin reductase-like flavin-dependent oxidoreductase (Luciferase family) n=1 Tax=Nocardioides thalensis TaxID=1914755 RepID=A0A853C4J7_9ACTN|nr:alkanesulfonate monooxygenase SsuD/methylene tetrahydromethanopterin reductase-like flavin-dependent oxidoreductase (luciferase family) [Nocardioides thalensis]